MPEQELRKAQPVIYRLYLQPVYCTSLLDTEFEPIIVLKRNLVLTKRSFSGGRGTNNPDDRPASLAMVASFAVRVPIRSPNIDESQFWSKWSNKQQLPQSPGGMLQLAFAPQTSA